jgi:integrase
MAIVPRKHRHGKVTFWVTFHVPWKKQPIWERSETPGLRAAEILQRDRRAQVKAGTYTPTVKGDVKVRSYLESYMAGRTNRSADNERELVENHILSDGEFCSMSMRAVRGRDCLRLVERMRARGRLGEKSIATVYGVMAGAFRRAAFDEVIGADPTPLPRGTLKRKTARANKRRPYPRHDAKLLVSDERIPWKQRVWNALAFYTGMREGEVCGRRWRAWQRDVGPLSRLIVDTQYDDQPLKTDDEEDVRPRFVPVHPELAAILDAWWEEGFELYMLRKPTLEDFIVPTIVGTHISRSRGYERFREALRKVNVENRTLHATRNTFISVCLSGGAQKNVVERITHNAKGDVIDDYTELEWRTLCDAVLCFDLNVDPNVDSGTNGSGDSGSRAWTRIAVGPRDLSGSAGKFGEFPTSPIGL